MGSLTTRDRESRIHKLAKKYLGKDEYPWLQPGEQRVIFKIVPDQVVHAS